MSRPAPSLPRLFTDASHQRRFERDGFVVVDVLDAGDLGRLRATWGRGAHHVSEMSFSSTIMSGDADYRRDVHAGVGEVLAPRILPLLVGYRFCLGGFVAKQGGDAQSKVELHQDWWFVDEDRFWSLGAWCPLSDVGPENGCLRALPGSHRLNRLPRGYMQDFAYPELAAEIEERYLVDVPMRAGQVFFSTQSLFHASPPNRSPAVRVAATGLVIPEASRLLFVTAAEDAVPTGQLGVYGVPDDFYVTHPWGSVPDASLRLSRVAAARAPLSREGLSALGKGAAGASV